MVKIDITPELKKLANEHANEQIKYEYDRFNLPYNERIDMILIGSIGQLCFKKPLNSLNISYEFEFQAGRYDKFDFKIKNKILEVKTSGFLNDFNNLNMQYNTDQYISGQTKDYFACAQIFINGYDRCTKNFDLDACDCAIIAGGLEFLKIKNYPIVQLTYSTAYRVPLNQLIDITDLINLMGEK